MTETQLKHHLLNTQLWCTQIQPKHGLILNPHIGQSVQAEAVVGPFK